MFCPECRKYWSGSRDAKAAEQPTKKSKAAPPLTCASCGALLAPDRLVAEFPATEQAQQAGRGVRERRITVEDVLRETASPNVLANMSHVVPLDERESRSNFLRGLFRRKEKNADEGVRVISRGPRKTAKAVAIDVCLGVAALGALVVLVLAVTTRITLNMRHGAAPASNAGAAELQKSAASPLATLLPAKVAFNWTRWEPDSALSSATDDSSEQSAWGTYDYGTHRVRLAVEHFANLSTARTALASIASEQVQLHEPSSVEALSAQWARIAGQDTVAFGPSSGSTSADSYTVDSATPAGTGLPFSRSWRVADNVFTVSSDSAQDRDEFTNGYLTQ
jgi:hypothetical protein